MKTRTSFGAIIFSGIFYSLSLTPAAIGQSAAPVLSIKAGTNSVFVSWPESDLTFILEQTDSLENYVPDADAAHLAATNYAPNWVRAPRPTYNSGRFELTVDNEPGNAADQRFFRLKDSTAIPSLVAANDYTAVIKADGTTWMWGNWFVGQSLPALLFESSGLFSSLGAGDLHTLALATDGGVWGWGDNDSGQINDFTAKPDLQLASGFSKVAAGAALSLALGTNGTIWGSGVIAFVPPATRPWGPINADTDWKDMAVGGIYDCANDSPCGAEDCRAITHALFLKTDGTLWAWGENTFGQLGIENADDQHLPARVGTATNWTTIAAGENHSLALRADGTLWAWGWNAFGQVGDGTLTDRATPQPIGSDTNWAVIAAGYRHSMALKTDGTLWTWGCNATGQLGDGSLVTTNAPMQIGAGDWVAIAGGQKHSAALKADGTIWTWGSNEVGQLGDGTTEPRLVPTEVGSTKH